MSKKVRGRRWGGIQRRASRVHKNWKGRAILKEHRKEMEEAMWALSNGYDACGVGNDLTLAKSDYFEVLVEKAPDGEVNIEIHKRRADDADNT